MFRKKFQKQLPVSRDEFIARTTDILRGEKPCPDVLKRLLKEENIDLPSAVNEAVDVAEHWAREFDRDPECKWAEKELDA